MGNKMSNSRGRSDQNTVSSSELTSVPLDPLVSFHASSESKQTKQNKVYKKDDYSHGLPAQRVKGQETKDINANQPRPDSHSWEPAASDSHVNLEKSDDINQQHNRDEPSEVITEEKAGNVEENLLSTDCHGKSKAVCRKPGRPSGRPPGRPPKRKRKLAVDKQDQSFAVLDAVKQDCNVFPGCIPNHNNGEFLTPLSADGPLDIDTPQNQCFLAVSAGLPEQGTAVAPKKKRGRPKRKTIKCSSEKGSVSAVTSTCADPDEGSRTLRRRTGRLNLTPDVNDPSDDKLDPGWSPRASSLSHRENKRTSNFRGFKRRKMLPSQQIPTNGKGKWNTNRYTAERNIEGSGRDGQLQTSFEEPFKAPPEVVPLNYQASLNSQVFHPKTKLALDVNGSDGPLQVTEANSCDVLSSEKDGHPSRTVSLPSLEQDDVNSNGDLKSVICADSNARTAVKCEFPNGSDDMVGNSLHETVRCSRYGRKINQAMHKEPLETSKQGQEMDNDCFDSDTDCSNDSLSKAMSKAKVPHRCKDCNRTFKFLSQYVIHRRTHTGERPFKCLVCGRGFGKNSNLNLHLKRHSKREYYASHVATYSHDHDDDSDMAGPEIHARDEDHPSGDNVRQPVAVAKKKSKQVCQYCGKVFRFHSALERHERVHTGEKPYKCEICGKDFSQSYFLSLHELNHWSVQRYNCLMCKKTFSHYRNATKHYCSAATAQPNMQYKRQGRALLSYTCHICKNTFYQMKEFKDHIQSHIGTKLYRCLLCDKLFGVLAEFNAHSDHCCKRKGERMIDGFRENADETKSEFSLGRDAKRCSAGRFSARPVSATLLRPEQTHPNEPPSFSQKPFHSTIIKSQHFSHIVSKLNKLDTRSDPRKYLCPSCGRLFRHMGRLRAHMLTHARSQSYTCGTCGKTLENWKKLWCHQRIHRQKRGRFTCPQCSQGFRFVEPYKRHVAQHLKFRWVQRRPNAVSLPYECEQCSASFKTLDLLFSHQLCHSSPQVIRGGCEFELSVDDENLNSYGIFSPSKDNHVKSLSGGPQFNHFRSPPSLPTDGLRGGGTEHSEPDPSRLGESAVPSTRHHTDEPSKSAQELSEPPSPEVVESIPDRTKGSSPGKSSAVLGKLQENPNSGGSQGCDGTSDGIKCAVCGSVYPAISELYEHYLQHAKGQF